MHQISRSHWHLKYQYRLGHGTGRTSIESRVPCGKSRFRLQLANNESHEPPASHHDQYPGPLAGYPRLLFSISFLLMTPSRLKFLAEQTLIVTVCHDWRYSDSEFQLEIHRSSGPHVIGVQLQKFFPLTSKFQVHPSAISSQLINNQHSKDLTPNFSLSRFH